MKKRQYIHPEIEIVALTDCNELLSGSAWGDTPIVPPDGEGGNDVEFNKQSSFSIFDDADDIYNLEEY